MEEAEVVQEKTEDEKREKKHERFQEEFQFIPQRTDPRLAFPR